MTDHAVAALQEALPGVGEGWVGECACGKQFQAWTRHDAERSLRGHINVQEARESLEAGHRAGNQEGRA